MPYSSAFAIGRHATRKYPLKGGRVVAKDPSMVRLNVSMTPEPNVDDSATQQQRGTLILSKAVERQLPIHRSLSGTRHCGLQHDRTANFFGTCRNAQGVQSLDVVGLASDDFLGLGDDIQRSAC